MKKQLFLSLALLTIGSALHAGKGAAFGGGFATGMLTGAVINNVSRPREREVVYVKDPEVTRLRKDPEVTRLRKENARLKQQLRKRKR